MGIYPYVVEFRAVLIEGFFFAQFLVFPYFPFSLPNIGMRSLPNIMPSVKLLNFQTLEMFAVFSAFPVFRGKNERKNW